MGAGPGEGQKLRMRDQGLGKSRLGYAQRNPARECGVRIPALRGHSMTCVIGLAAFAQLATVLLVSWSESS